MINYFNEWIKSGSVFWFCALAGSGMFLIQFIINIFGMGDHSSDLTPDSIHHADQNPTDIAKFKWLSMQTITGFLMVFGWTAITCQHEFKLSNPATIAISLIAGVFAGFIIRSILKLAQKLKSSGNIYKIEDAIGKEAYVYQRIPKGGIGKISMTLQGFTHEIDAISHNADELPSFMHVKIIEKTNDNTVVVRPL